MANLLAFLQAAWYDYKIQNYHYLSEGGVGMRRIAAVFIALLVIMSLAVTASASSASNIQITAIVASDGSCQVTQTVNLTLTAATDNLTYPLPADARGITVNGSSVSTHKADGYQYADISRMVKGMTGQFSLIFSYTLPNCVTFDELDRTIVTVPLLSGFTYPVDNMSFAVTLPGEIAAKPTFTSGYYQSSIETVLHSSVSGQIISGYSTNALKDLETMSMSIEMPTELFPRQQVQEWSVAFDDIAMYVFAGLALVYWILFLRCLPPRRISRFLPPDGVNAGEIGSALTGQGASLTMMLLHWAQLGYVLIHLDKHGRVMLHRRMDMGNERSAFENRVFRALFGKKDMIDGTGYHYARLYRKVASTKPELPGHFRRGTGNPAIFRVLACGIGVFGGMSLGFAIGEGAFLVGFMVFVMVTFGGVSAWLIQSGVRCMFLHDKKKLWIALGCCAAWLLFGAIAGQLGIAAAVAGAELLAGLAAAYSGRRTEQGRQAMAQILGLRRYLRSAPKDEALRRARMTPEFFFSMMPYALALGVEDRFAKQFGAMRLPGCPYLTTGMDAHMTAAEWAKLMNTAIARLDERQKNLAIERLLAK